MAAGWPGGSGSGDEPAIDPDEAAGDELYDELHDIARRHWTAMAMLEAERRLDVLDAEIVDEKP